MAVDPPSIPEHSDLPSHTDPSCPFCSITQTYSPIAPRNPLHQDYDPERLSPPTFILLSTPHVVAFLDIAPLTRGHVLVTPRHHRTKIGDLTSSESAELGRVLPVVARAALAATFPDISHDEVDYNVVQNNGPGAAQVIPHVHFHVIPRPPLDYKPPSPGVTKKYAKAEVPTGLKASYVQFGRGQRHELDEEDAEVLIKDMRERLKVEWEKEFGGDELVGVASRESKL